MKSNINSDQVKKIVADVVECAINECASQHEANGQPYEGYDSINLTEDGLPTPMGLIQPSEQMLKLANNQPVKLKITFEYYWEGSERSNMYCAPTIDLTTIKDDKSSE
jgi:hypothetical protein